MYTVNSSSALASQELFVVADPEELAMVLICGCKEQQTYRCLFINRCLKVKGAKDRCLRYPLFIGAPI